MRRHQARRALRRECAKQIVEQLDRMLLRRIRDESGLLHQGPDILADGFMNRLLDSRRRPFQTRFIAGKNF